MRNEKNIVINDTAFLTCTFRALNEDLSKDRYAKLWTNPNTEKWISKYLDEVSSEEIPTHCLRNRYFLETIKTLFAKMKLKC